MESRVRKSITNAQVNLLFYIILLVATFFSRKIFIDSLGNEFVGLTSTLQNILGLFNLAELGISSAIAFSLYKPLFDKNHERITELISIFGYLYQRIGYIITGIGIIVAVFLPFIFKKSILDLGIIYFAYFSYLIISLFTYFFNYKQTLLAADQKEYYVTIYYQLANIIKICVQIGLLLQYKNPYIWLLIELIFGIIYCFILNSRVKKVYPWLQSTIKQGKESLPNYPEIPKYIKQIFVHKLASVALLNTSSIFIYSFSSLSLVTYFMNYNLIILKVDALITQLLNSTSAGVGNLVAEGNRTKIKKVFEELLAIRYFIAILLSLCIYFCINQFISIWLGSEYLLSNNIIILIITAFYLKQTGEIVDQFLRAHGLFYDIWAPLTEASINILVSIIGGLLWGLEGVLWGPIISMLVIVHFWKPYFLYSKGLNISVLKYWKIIIIYTSILFTTFFIYNYMNFNIIIPQIEGSNNLLNFILYCVVTVLSLSILLIGEMMLFSSGIRSFLYRIYKTIRK